MEPFRHVLTPIDFSSCSTTAFRLGSAIAEACGARLTLLHVYPFTAPPDAETPYFPRSPAPLDQETGASIARELRRLDRRPRDNVPIMLVAARCSKNQNESCNSN